MHTINFEILKCFSIFLSNSFYCDTEMFNCVWAGYIFELERLHRYQVSSLELTERCKARP